MWLPKVDPCAFAPGTSLLEGASDTDFVGDKASRKSMSSKVVKVDNCLLFTRVTSQSLVATSSGEAEFYGLTDLAVETKPIKDILEWLGFRVVWKCGSDSSAARAMGLRMGIGRVRHLDTRALWTQRMVRECGLILPKLLGQQNAADLGTKHHSVAEFRRLRDLSGLVSGELAAAQIVEVNQITRQSRGNSSSDSEIRVALVALLTALLASNP